MARRRLNVNVTRRDIRRKQRDGSCVTLTRYVVNYRDPRSGRRHQSFFERHKDAVDRRDQIIADYRDGMFVADQTARQLTVAVAVDRWLKNREGEVTERTLRGYREAARLITKAILIGTPKERYLETIMGEKAVGGRYLPSIAHIKVADLNTSDIRTWHKALSTEVGAYSANRAKMFLRTSLALAAEDWNIRPPAMPMNLGRGRVKGKKAILSPDQVALVIKAARGDADRGLYYAFPFMTGVRPCELLGLLWDDLDFERNVICIRRSQGDKGELLLVTKTAAGMREIPMGSMLKQWLLEWRIRCPRLNGRLHRVFPGPGARAAWPAVRSGGGPLTYQNFRKRVWNPGLAGAGVPHVTPHSARHTFISTLQAQGVEVGLVAKLAGHANPSVTLGHYTQAVRGGEDAVQALERALGA